MRKFRPLKRAVEKRPPKKKFVIFTEGQNTEPSYFRELKRFLSGTLIDVEIVEAAGVPLTIAKKACALAKSMSSRSARRSSFGQEDKVWAVFDRDEHPGVDDAKQQCANANVGVGFSDPCFEIWLILHYSDFDRPDGRHEVQKHFENICPGYDRNGRKTANCEALMPLIEVAEKRAMLQLSRRIEEGGLQAPFTTVGELTKELREASAASEAYSNNF